MQRPSATIFILSTTLLSLTLADYVTPSFAVNATTAAERARRLSIFKKVFTSDYLRFHKMYRHTAPRLVYRLCLRQPGLGDRLTGFLHAYVSAVLTGRIFLIDWRYPFDIAGLLLSNSGARFYYEESDDRMEKQKKTLHCLTKCVPGNLTQYGDSFTVVQNRTQPMLVRDIVRIARNHLHFAPAARFLKGFGENSFDDEGMPSEGEVFGEIFRAVLRTSPQMNRFMIEHAGELMERRFIAVHARLGTGVREGGPRFEGKVSWNELAECLGRKALAMSTRLHGDGTLFLATDSPGFRHVFRRVVGKLGGKERNVLFGTWGTKHVGRMRAGNERDLKLFKMALMDCLLLGRGIGMVSTRSRFATMGAYFGGIKEREEVEPGKC